MATTFGSAEIIWFSVTYLKLSISKIRVVFFSCLQEGKDV